MEHGYPQPPRPPDPRVGRAGVLLVVIGIIADATALVGLWSAKPLALVLVAAFLALALGVWLMIRLWGGRFGVAVLMAQLCVIASVVLGAIAVTLPTDESTADPGGTATGSKHQPTEPGSTTETDAPGSNLRVRLGGGTGTDVDSGSPKARRVTGVAEDIDLYFAEGNYFKTTGMGFINYRESDGNAQSTCAYSLKDKVAKWEYLPTPQIDVEFCFATSDGRVGWLRVEGITSPGPDSDGELELSVRVW
ncbi:hypothetical protein V5P93_000804 [Actinokineospora auranticolor]|uniref:Uncharacterized protein n=1 Tax=Actinokineospora auranticolor TaxID=155976 RepID=A0A2S6GYS1_9PSEU|nr:hypothetical protein [Actinokineospora auranticolor]PPK70317.1 hypothetical protein CLV40_102229 [Actinokineospora auranticolor]